MSFQLIDIEDLIRNAFQNEYTQFCSTCLEVTAFGFAWQSPIQQTRGIGPRLSRCWADVVDGVPTFKLGSFYISHDRTYFL